jgi:hypothetical protein
MSTNQKTINLGDLSPRALSILTDLAKTTGLNTPERTIEELCFTILELTQIVDTQKDPLLEPEAARRQMETMRGILQRYKRFDKMS